VGVGVGVGSGVGVSVGSGEGVGAGAAVTAVVVSGASAGTTRPQAAREIRQISASIHAKALFKDSSSFPLFFTAYHAQKRNSRKRKTAPCR